MTPLRRFASSPVGGRTQWPGKAGSTGALGGVPRSGAEHALDLSLAGHV
jgi:hypothetical protein